MNLTKIICNEIGIQPNTTVLEEQLSDLIRDVIDICNDEVLRVYKDTPLDECGCLCKVQTALDELRRKV